MLKFIFPIAAILVLSAAHADSRDSRAIAALERCLADSPSTKTNPFDPPPPVPYKD